MPPPIPSGTAARVEALARDWAESDASERASFQTWLIRFCEALDVPPPASPPVPDDTFERAVHTIDREGRESVNYIDYWKAAHVAIEAKASGTMFAFIRTPSGKLRRQQRLMTAAWPTPV
jgi:hypothetical protein